MVPRCWEAGCEGDDAMQCAGIVNHSGHARCEAPPPAPPTTRSAETASLPTTWVGGVGAGGGQKMRQAKAKRTRRAGE